MVIGRRRARNVRSKRRRSAVCAMAERDRVERSSHSLDKSITLPPDEIFRNLENAKRFAIDIGRSLGGAHWYEPGGAHWYEPGGSHWFGPSQWRYWSGV